MSKKSTAKSKKDNGAHRQMAFAISLAWSGYFFDAIKVFRSVADTDNALAGSAWCNIGLTYLQMRLYKEAERAFSKVINSFPKDRLSQSTPSEERGPLSAKAHLGRVHARLGQDNRSGAGKDLGALETYKKSYVVDEQGHQISFRELAAMQF